MSLNLTQETAFNDIECLHQTITDLGFTAVCNETYELLTMDGYAGQKFEANIGIRRDEFTKVAKMHSYGDLGFSRVDADSSFTLTADDSLVQGHQWGAFYDNFSAKYAEKAYVKNMYQQGFGLVGAPQETSEGVLLEFAQIGGLS